MKKVRLFTTTLTIIIVLSSLAPTAFAKSSKIPPDPPDDYWNYPLAEGTDVSATAPKRGLKGEQNTTALTRAQGYYYEGAILSRTNEGLKEKIYVTNPHVPHPSDDFFCACIHVSDTSTNNYFEVGWSEDGWEDNKQYIYVQHGSNGEWVEWQFYRVYAGGYIRVSLKHSGNQWTAWLWWNNAWKRLVTRTLPFSSAPRADQVGEAYLATAQEPWFIPNTAFKEVYLYVYIGPRLRTRRWDTYFQSYTTIVDSGSPYHAVWNAYYYDWYMYCYEP